jgi:hypothetical protein
MSIPESFHVCVGILLSISRRLSVGFKQFADDVHMSCAHFAGIWAWCGFRAGILKQFANSVQTFRRYLEQFAGVPRHVS